MQMRVGILLLSPSNSGGVYQYSLTVLEALAALRASGFETIAVYQDGVAWADHLKRLELSSVCVKPGILGKLVRRLYLLNLIPLSMWRFLAPKIHAIARTIQKQKADLWIFPAQDDWTYSVPCKAIGTVHDLMHRYESRFPEVSENNLFKKRERAYQALCSYSAAVLVDSETGKKQVIESYGIAPEKVFVLPYVARTNPSDADSELSAPDLAGKKYFFYPAQFWQHKNHKVLVEATALLKQREGLRVSWVFVGSQRNEYQATVDLIQSKDLNDQFQILGFVDDSKMNSLFKCARALIMPTFFGPTNIPPLEAQALGCPVAVSRIYGMPAQLGDSALYFDPNSVQEVAEVLKRLWLDDALIGDLRKKGILRNQSWCLSHFIEKLGDIFHQVRAAKETKKDA